MGAEAVQALMKDLDVDAEVRAFVKKFRRQIRDQTEELSKRLKLLGGLYTESGNKPEWMVMTVLPVLPPDFVLWFLLMVADSRLPILTICIVV